MNQIRFTKVNTRAKSNSDLKIDIEHSSFIKFKDASRKVRMGYEEDPDQCHFGISLARIATRTRWCKVLVQIGT